MGYVLFNDGERQRVGFASGDVVATVHADTLAEAAMTRAPTNGATFPRDAVSLLAPIEGRAKVLCVALNYVDHAKESNQPLPSSPILFFKSHEAMISGVDDIRAPDIIKQLDYEGEIAIVIGKGGFNISKADAWDHIAGLTTFNDVSARDLFKVKAGDKEHLDWFSGKCLDSSTPIGPEVIPLADVIDQLKNQTMRVRTLVNGEVRQDAVIRDMVFDIPTLVSFASSRVRLSPGDIIATGTPPGVGAGSGRFISRGDEVRVEVSGLPTMVNRVA